MPCACVLKRMLQAVDLQGFLDHGTAGVDLFDGVAQLRITPLRKTRDARGVSSSILTDSALRRG